MELEVTTDDVLECIIEKFNPEAHPRYPVGHKLGGRFAPKHKASPSTTSISRTIPRKAVPQPTVPDITPLGLTPHGSPDATEYAPDEITLSDLPEVRPNNLDKVISSYKVKLTGRERDVLGLALGLHPSYPSPPLRTVAISKLLGIHSAAVSTNFKNIRNKLATSGHTLDDVKSSVRPTEPQHKPVVPTPAPTPPEPTKGPPSPKPTPPEPEITPQDLPKQTTPTPEPSTNITAQDIPLPHRIAAHPHLETKRKQILSHCDNKTTNEYTTKIEQATVEMNKAKTRYNEACDRVVTAKATLAKIKTNKARDNLEIAQMLQGDAARAFNIHITNVNQLKHARENHIAATRKIIFETLAIKDPKKQLKISLYGAPTGKFPEQLRPPEAEPEPGAPVRCDIASEFDLLCTIVDNGGHPPPTLSLDYITDPKAQQRAKYKPWSKQIAIGQLNGPGVMVHEMMHCLEHQNPTIAAAAQAFLAYRIGDEKPQPLNNVVPGKRGCYESWESGCKDDFGKAFGDKSFYVGKIYEENGKIVATEILSMGLEKIFCDGGNFAERDPEYFNFIIGVLDGSLRG